MTSFEFLPPELVFRIIAYLDKPSLAHVRLSIPRFEQCAVEQLFKRISLYPQWNPDAEEDVYSVDSDRWGRCRCGNPEHDEVRSLTGSRGLSDGGSQGRDVLDNEMDGFLEEDDLYQHERSPESRPEHSSDGQEIRSSLEEEQDVIEALSNPTEDNTRTTQSLDEVVPYEASDNYINDEFDEFVPAESDDASVSSSSSTFSSYWEPCGPRFDDFLLPISEFPAWISEGFPAPPGYKAQKFLNILSHETLKHHVKVLNIYTCEPHCDLHPAMFRGRRPPLALDTAYHECIKRLGEFPQLESVTVHFDRHNDDGAHAEVPQTGGQQRIWLRRIFHSLAKSELREVAVRHLENPQYAPGCNWKAPLFLEKLAGCTTLRLSVKHAETSSEAGPLYRGRDLQSFWTRFPFRFLQPPRPQLKTLVLYSDLPLGWFPKLDLRSIHFPCLGSLTFGHHIFHNPHQIDWILSHKATLHSLFLDHCSILYQIGYTIDDWLDSDGYPIPQQPHDGMDYLQYTNYDSSLNFLDFDRERSSEFAQHLQFRSNALRWYDIFKRFAEGLNKLRTFRFGSSTQWDFETVSRWFYIGRYHNKRNMYTGMPKMPWEAEYDIKNSLFEGMYVIWDDWDNMYRPRWDVDRTLPRRKREKELRRYIGHGRHDFEGWSEEWMRRLEGYPECGESDSEALARLLDRVRNCQG